MLCDKCQIREARVHLTICTSPAVEKPKRKDLCQECFEASGLEGAAGLSAALQAGCRFCGGEACGGGFDPLALLGGVRKLSFMCKSCSGEYYGFLRRKLRGFGDGDLTEEQRAAFMAKFKSCDFPAILIELDAHMKKWVAARDSQ